MARDEFNFSSSYSGITLHGMRWLPEGEPKAVLQIVHGLAEHIGRYDAFAEFMTKNGFAVVGESHIGHGKSAGAEDELGYLPQGSWKNMVKDIDTLRKMEQEKYPDLPYFILGHSMGSFLTRTYITKYGDGLSGCVIMGTGQQPNFEVNLGLSLVERERKKHGEKTRSDKLNKLCFVTYNSKCSPRRTEYDWLSRDPEVADSFIDDKTCGFVPTIGLFGEMLSAVKYIGNMENINKVPKDLPVLFLSGTGDPVGSYGKAVQQVYEKFKTAGVKDVDITLYKDARHELLNETNKEEVYNRVLTWINSKM